MADRALLTGINAYTQVSKLRGCISDVRQMKELLKSRFDFSDDSIKTLTDEQVTKAGITDGWQWLLDGAVAGDRLVFHFSGHGSYTDDQDGDEEDGVDELLCLVDMDFDDPHSYLLDDDLYELTSQVPPGVALTLFLDCCHSGTGTRALRPARSMARESNVAATAAQLIPRVIVSDTRVRSARSASEMSLEMAGDGQFEAAPEAVLARFVTPPARVQERLQTAGRRSGLGRESVRTMNHVLLSGCQADQTSADAYIDGQYRGAFTYHLCSAVEDSTGDLEKCRLVADVRQRLQQQSFSQIPQLEPVDTTGPLLGVERSSDSNTVGSPASPPALDPSQLIGTLRQLIDQLQTIDWSKATSLAGQLTTRDSGRTGQRSLVYVHGICEHTSGFSNDWFAAMSPHLPGDLRQQLSQNRHEVVWSQHVTNTRDLVHDLGSSAKSVEYELLREAIVETMGERIERQKIEEASQPRDGAPHPTAAESPRALFGIPGLDCVDDFLKYLLNDNIRRRVLGEFENVVRPLLQQGHRVDVISHSWGTVVALEALHRLSVNSSGGQVANLFVVGSPLSMGVIRNRLRYGAETGNRPRLVGRWLNLDAKGDPVGGPIKGNPFAVDLEYLNLVPTSCRRIGSLVSPACAHSSYFASANHAVNRDIFAKWLGR